ncbi:hypothetical protein DXG01_005923, partial [Tephrocybe rancida]
MAVSAPDPEPTPRGAEQVEPPIDLEPRQLEAGRPKRAPRLPKQYKDFIPHLSLPLLNINVPQVSAAILNVDIVTVPSDGVAPSVNPKDPTMHPATPPTPEPRFQTPRNIFGLSRTYCSSGAPTHDPDDHTTLSDMFDDNAEPCPIAPTAPLTQLSPYHPYPNQNSFSLGNWYWNHGAQKSQEDFKVLLDIVGDPGFNPLDIQATPWTAINKALGSNNFDGDEDQLEWEDEDAGWHRTPVTLNVPFHKFMKNPGTHPHVVGDLYHRSIMSVIKEKLANPTDVDHLHYEPYKLSWVPSPEFKEVRVYGELYTSPAGLDAHREVQALPQEPGCTLPRCVLSLMVWSDATHLTSFGSSKLWPGYLYIGNESKYRRSKPSLHLANHIAYFQVLPDSFKDFASEHIGGKGTPTPAFLAHCRKEFFHTQWSILLDEEFLEAWRHGIVIMCLDGIKRRFYPRIITYSADYPEKALLASIRNGGRLPCPRCFVSKAHLCRMGMKSDMKHRVTAVRLNNQEVKDNVKAARDYIYTDRYAVNSKAVETILQPLSLVPAMNAFSETLGDLGFNHYQMLVVDILHEWEVGTWKSILIHLIRLVHESKGNNVGLLDARYRQIPTFGRDTIRKFAANTSELKRLGARDFADLLQ